MRIIIVLGMLNLVGFFRLLNIENMPYKFGKGSFYKVIGPLGTLLGSFISGEEITGKIAWIIGIILNIIILITLLFFT